MSWKPQPIPPSTVPPNLHKFEKEIGELFTPSRALRAAFPADDGWLDEHGFFSPDRDQSALSHLLSTAGLARWEDFHAAMDPRDNLFELSHPDRNMADMLGMRRKVIPGLSVMHESTFRSICDLSRVEEDTADAAARASVIVMDASERWEMARQTGTDLSSMIVSQLGRPPKPTWQTAAGRLVEVPVVSRVFSETAPYQMSVYAKDAIVRSHLGSHLSDGVRLRETFEALAGFQRFSIGLHVLNRYYAPSNFTRSDNLFEAVDYQITSINFALEGVSERPRFEPEYGDENREELAMLADSLRELLGKVERELEAYSSPTSPKHRF